MMAEQKPTIMALLFLLFFRDKGRSVVYKPKQADSSRKKIVPGQPSGMGFASVSGEDEGEPAGGTRREGSPLIPRDGGRHGPVCQLLKNR
jgi:hypothetical protein